MMDNNIRPLRELLQVFLDNQDLFDSGLCGWTGKLMVLGFISEEEEKYVDNLLAKEHRYSPFEIIWTMGSIEPRLNWLKENLK